MQDGGSFAELEANGIRVEEIAEIFQKVPTRRKLLLFDFLFLGDARYASERDEKTYAQRSMRVYPEVSLQPGRLPLLELAALGERELLSHVAVALSSDAASRLGTRGPLAAALRGSLAGESDGNADGRERLGSRHDGRCDERGERPREDAGPRAHAGRPTATR